MSGRSKKNKITKDPVLLDQQDIENLGRGVEADSSADQEKIVDDKYPYMIALANRVNIVANEMTTSEDVGLTAMFNLLTMSAPIVRDPYKTVLQQERAKYSQYVRDAIHLSVPRAGYAVPGEKSLRTIEEGKRCSDAYWREQNGEVELEPYGQSRETHEDAALWRRMRPVPYSASRWLAKLRADVGDTLAVVIDALNDADLLLHTRRSEPVGGDL